MCPLDEYVCNPEACPYAKGHFDRINDAVFDLLTKEDAFDREVVLEYALLHEVCPFEMCLDMSLFSDGIICDYNYLFDPYAYLRRFFCGCIERTVSVSDRRGTQSGGARQEYVFCGSC